jgi:hypothetical protein
MRNLIFILLFFPVPSAWAQNCAAPANAAAVQKSLKELYTSVRAKSLSASEKKNILQSAAYQIECQLDQLNQEPGAAPTLHFDDARRWALVAAQNRLRILLNNNCNHERMQFENNLGATGETAADDGEISGADWEKAYCP